jgi:hypothetical protein
MILRALVFGAAVATAAAALPAAAWAAPEAYSELAAPFSPNATIYRPDCWIKENPSNRWGNGNSCFGE